MSVTGTWNLTLNSPLGDQAARLDLHDTGGVLQGTLTGKGDPAPLQRAAYDVSVVSFAADADTPVGRLNLAFSGTASIYLPALDQTLRIVNYRTAAPAGRMMGFRQLQN